MRCGFLLNHVLLHAVHAKHVVIATCCRLKPETLDAQVLDILLVLGLTVTFAWSLRHGCTSG
jgi:hypothetical protein